MPSLNFTMFVDQVLDGRKTQTIRSLRKHPIKVGDTLHLFTGMRRPGCRRLSPKGGVICTHVAPCWMRISDDALPIIIVDGRELSTPEQLELARLDGFVTAMEFRRWFQGLRRTRVFDGQLIRWNYWGTLLHNTHD